MCQYTFRRALHEPAVNKEKYGGAQERRVSLHEHVEKSVCCMLHFYVSEGRSRPSNALTLTMKAGGFIAVTFFPDGAPVHSGLFLPGTLLP
jgi:hypothetical protein